MKANFLSPLLIFTLLFTFISPNTVHAHENEVSKFSEEAIYDLTIGGTQIFKIMDSTGNIAYITVSEEPSLSRIGNGTYKITYTEPQFWTAGFYATIKSDSIISAKDKFYSALSGTVIQSKLILESSKQASHYFTYKFGTTTLSKSTGVRAIIFGTSLKISKI